MYKVLVQDDSGHWYLVSGGSEAEFDQWVTWMSGLDDSPWEGQDFGSMQIDGPHTLRILEYEN